MRKKRVGRNRGPGVLRTPGPTRLMPALGGGKCNPEIFTVPGIPWVVLGGVALLMCQ